MKSKAFFVALALALTLSLTAQAQEPTIKAGRKYISLEEADIRCQKLPDEKRAISQICKDVRKKLLAYKEKQKYPFFSTRIETNFYHTDIQASDKLNGGEMMLGSRHNLELGVSLYQHYTDNFKSYLSVNYRNFEIDNTLAIPFSNPTQNLWAFGLGVNYNPTPRLSLAGGIVFEELYFIRARDLNSLVFDQYQIPGLRLKIGYDLFTLGQTDIGLALEGKVYKTFDAENYEEPTGNYRVGTVPWNYNVEVYARKQFKTWAFQGSLIYRQEEIRTEIVKQSEKTVGASLKFAIPFGYAQDRTEGKK